MIWRLLFGALGITSFAYILQAHGLARLGDELSALGWWSLPLAMSFLPVAICYALAWLLITPGWPPAQAHQLLSFTVISVAWNNLSPFVKVLGEPVRVVLLERRLGRREAMQSMVLYNIVHIMGTLFSFFVGALVLLLFFPVSSGLRAGFFSLLVISPLLAFALFYLPRLHWRWNKENRFYRVSFWLRWSLHKIRLFAHRYPARFWAAVALEIAARFVEGVTFYVAFLALGRPLSPAVCAVLDVGRALIDNLFFFVPYQVGSREGGILVLAENAVGIGSAGVVSAAVLYRIVEILWMGIGYLLWILPASSKSDSR